MNNDQRPKKCISPCGKVLDLEWLKANVPDEDVKKLWAALGGRKTRRRAISPENQRKMQEARVRRKQAAETNSPATK